MMTCALIITTYNWKESLELVLRSVLEQSVIPTEVIIADDGSNLDTVAFIQSLIEESPLNIIHSWQKDDGFRASRSRNKAIARSTAEYIVLIDGDIILHSEFIADHIKHAEKGVFLQGGRVLLDERTSLKLLKTKKFSAPYLGLDVKNKKNNIHSNILATLFLSKSQSLKGIKTCNMSFFKKDCQKINGFNNDFVGWGREDSEFVVRLFNAGIKRKNVKFNAVSYHIWHNENPRNSLLKNDMLLEKALNEKLVYCENGISQI